MLPVTDRHAKGDYELAHIRMLICDSVQSSAMGAKPDIGHVDEAYRRKLRAAIESAISSRLGAAAEFG